MQALVGPSRLSLTLCVEMTNVEGGIASLGRLPTSLVHCVCLASYCARLSLACAIFPYNCSVIFLSARCRQRVVARCRVTSPVTCHRARTGTLSTATCRRLIGGHRAPARALLPEPMTSPTATHTTDAMWSPRVGQQPGAWAQRSGHSSKTWSRTSTQLSRARVSYSRKAPSRPMTHRSLRMNL